VTELEAALEPVLEGSAGTEAWLPVDPDLTQPGPRPTSGPGADLPPVPTQERGRRRRRALVTAAAAVLGLGLGVPAGYLAQRAADEPVDPTLADATGTLEVTVPASWDAVADDGWQPPNAEASKTFAGLSVGGSAGWAGDPEAHGVFVGLLPGDELPEQTPQHPECDNDDGVVNSTVDGLPSSTTYYSGCPGGVTVERVAQVAGNRLLWVQVRSTDRATAAQVLESVAARL